MCPAVIGPTSFRYPNGRESHRGNTAAPRAIGVTTKLAGFAPRCEVCRERPRCLGKDAAIGRCRRRQKFLDHAFAHVQLALILANPQQDFDYAPPFIGSETFDVSRATLGCEDAHPNLLTGGIG